LEISSANAKVFPRAEGTGGKFLNILLRGLPIKEFICFVALGSHIETGSSTEKLRYLISFDIVMVSLARFSAFAVSPGEDHT
jgi:hypothetical protein